MDKVKRILSIVDKLSTEERVCIKKLAIELDENIRNIQNDFKAVLNPYFGDKLNKVDDCYFLLKREQFYNLFQYNHKTSKQFLKFLSVVDFDLYNRFKEEHTELIKALKLDSSAVYQIENSPYEKLKSASLEILEELEKAISLKQYINLTYSLPQKESKLFSHSMPLKILYLGSNWYLATLTTNDIVENSTFRLLRINFISKITKPKIEPISFHDDNIEKIEADRFIKNIQSSFSNINTTPYRVVLKVHPDKARYFQNKKYLTTQTVIKSKDDGLLVSYLISNDMEIIPLIQRWIPFVSVVEPLRIKEKIDENLKLFMKGL